ncbi:MAG: hypothetical protein CMN76_19630 [Spirochaetaceae bacterium]|nr:hypothetical protein [Spirochaetaceae bacterium]|tara:strand:+ start:34795 stop:36771 length:1977 start_codon:yes stop_codon:yes gene_type:complete
MIKLLKAPFQSMVFSAIVFGILSALSLAPFNFPLTTYLALWILFYQAQKQSLSAKRLLWFGFMAAFWLCVFGFYWTIHLFTVYGGLPIYVAVFTFIPYTFLLNLKIPFLMLALGVLNRKKYRRLRLPSLILIPTVAVALDLLFPQVFNWYWGNLIAGNPYFAQLAEYVGIHGLSFLLVFLSYGSFKLLKGQPWTGIYWNRFKSVQRWKAASPIVAVAVAGLVFGAYKKSSMEDLQKDLPHVTALTIQPDAPLEKAGGAQEVTWPVIRDIMEITIPDLAQQAKEEARKKDLDVELVVLPESAVPYFTTQDNFLTRKLTYGYRPEYEKMVLDLADAFEAEVFFNQNAFGISRDPNTGMPRRDVHNSSSLFARNGQRAGYYHKQILIAFGEQIPYATFLEDTGLIMLVPESVRYSRFRPGTEYTLLPYQSKDMNSRAQVEVRYGNLSDPQAIKTEDIQALTRKLESRDFQPTGQFMPLICYEILSPDYIRDFFHENSANPDFMVNITQDKWYGKTIETFQHFELGRIRAIETRRAILRSTNSGTSGMVDIAGNYVTPEVGPRLTGQEVKDFQIFRVPVHRSEDTFYVSYGDSWFLIPFLALVGFWFVGRKKPGNRRSGNQGRSRSDATGSSPALESSPARVQMPRGKKTSPRRPTRRRNGK